jgi:replicative DNA helicase
MLLHQDNVSTVLRKGVRAIHYSSRRHSLIHDSIIDASIETRGRCDAVTVATFLDKAGLLEVVGGIEYLVEILDSDFPVVDLSELALSVIRPPRRPLTDQEDS